MAKPCLYSSPQFKISQLDSQLEPSGSTPACLGCTSALGEKSIGIAYRNMKRQRNYGLFNAGSYWRGIGCVLLLSAHRWLARQMLEWARLHCWRIVPMCKILQGKAIRLHGDSSRRDTIFSKRYTTHTTVVYTPSKVARNRKRHLISEKSMLSKTWNESGVFLVIYKPEKARIQGRVQVLSKKIQGYSRWSL